MRVLLVITSYSSMQILQLQKEGREAPWDFLFSVTHLFWWSLRELCDYLPDKRQMPYCKLSSKHIFSRPLEAWLWSLVCYLCIAKSAFKCLDTILKGLYKLLHKLNFREKNEFKNAFQLILWFYFLKDSYLIFAVMRIVLYFDQNCIHISSVLLTS